MASDNRTPLTASNDNVEHGKYENSAKADRNETQSGAEHPPVTDNTTKHDGTKATDEYRIFARERGLYVGRNAGLLIPLANAQNLEDYVLKHPTT
jgi:hypothetical protein